jgi:glycosyltransferase involved in cell wall biosynthesis
VVNSNPKLTIGLMVYNEADYLDKTFESIFSQDIDNYEILVGNNASTDGSSEIIDKWAKKYPEIVHIKRPFNIGALQNWNDIIERARGEYFVLAGGHDLWSPTYLKSLIDYLDFNKRVVIAFAQTQWIDECGNNLSIPTSLLDTSGMQPLAKFVSLMFAGQHYLYGMMRLSAVKKTRRQLEVIGSGEIFLQELAQYGDFCLVEGERWYRRKNRIEISSLQTLKRYQTILFSNRFNRVRFKIFPHLQMMLLYLILPFHMKNVGIIQRLSMFVVSPLILRRFSTLLVLDVKWLSSHGGKY